FLDVVADRANVVDVLSGGIVQNPFLVAAAGEYRAGITTAHGDHYVGGLHDLVSPGFGVLTGDVDANLGHRLRRRGVDFIAGFGATRPCNGRISCQVSEESHRQLRTARVVGAEEQHDGFAVVGGAFDFGQG